MDPITAAIVAALSTGALSGLTDTGKVVITATYDSLKALLIKKSGGKSAVAQSLELLEEKPDSVGRQQTLTEEIFDAQVVQDPEIVQVAQNLLDLVHKQPGGERFIQQVTGNYTAFVQGSGNAIDNIGDIPAQFGGGGGGTGGGDDE